MGKWGATRPAKLTALTAKLTRSRCRNGIAAPRCRNGFRSFPRGPAASPPPQRPHRQPRGPGPARRRNGPGWPPSCTSRSPRGYPRGGQGMRTRQWRRASRHGNCPDAWQMLEDTILKKPFWSNFLMTIAEIAISTAIWMGAMVWDACDHILHVGNPSQLVKELALFFRMFFFLMFLMAFGHVREIPYGNLGGLDVPGPIWNCCLFHNGRGELFGLTCPHLEPNLRKWKGFRAHENNFCWSFAHGISEYCITPKRNPGLVLDLFL